MVFNIDDNNFDFYDKIYHHFSVIFSVRFHFVWTLVTDFRLVYAIVVEKGEI